MRFFQLFATFWRVGILNELQYRVNFFVQVFQSTLGLITGLFGLGLVFTHTPTLGGWTQPELLAVMGVHILTGGLLRATVQPNMERLMGDIQEGTLDYALTKPVDAQILVSVREVRVWQLVDVVMGLIVLGSALYWRQVSVSALNVLGFGAALLLGGAMLYSFWLMLTTGAFWVVRIENILELFQGAYAAGRWPVTLYPDWLRYSLTFLVPVAFAVTVPAEALTDRLTLETLALAAVVAGVLLALSRWVWQQGVKNYSGASA